MDNSPSLGIRHRWPDADGRRAPLVATSTRIGGRSVGPYASLNLGFHVGDDPLAVQENRGRFLAWLGIARLVVAHQTHSTRVAQVSGRDVAGPEGDDAPLVADALLTDVPGVGLGVTVADCVPLLLYDEEHETVAAVHAGWRGVLAGIVGETVRSLAAAYGTEPSSLRAVMGPAIGPCCYQVGDDLRARFRAAFGEDVVRGRALDLSGAVCVALLRESVRSERMSVTALCTRCHPELFFSYRRDGERTGRMVGVVAVR